MTDFRDMASKARAAHEKLVDEKQQKSEAERKQRSDFVETAIERLESHVMPLLKKAESDFKLEDIDTRISQEYDVKSRAAVVFPSIKFQCLSPKRKSDGFQTASPGVVFISDGKKLTVHGEKGDYGTTKTDLGTAPIEESNEVVRKALDHALSAHFQQLRSRPLPPDW